MENQVEKLNLVKLGAGKYQFGEWQFAVLDDNQEIVGEVIGKIESLTNSPEISERFFLKRKELTQITIPSSVTSIGGWAFSVCSRLGEITILSSAAKINDGVFDKCINLKEINITNSLFQSMGGNYIDVCKKLELPDNIKMLVAGKELDKMTKEAEPH